MIPNGDPLCVKTSYVILTLFFSYPLHLSFNFEVFFWFYLSLPLIPYFGLVSKLEVLLLKFSLKPNP